MKRISDGQKTVSVHGQKGKTMRLIDAHDVIAKIEKMETVDVVDVVESIIMSQTVDAVPVIRCKDCKHWQCDDDESYCEELGIFNTDMNSYCSYAKRKEE